jgi:Arc/MetJ-type ribon-helix-helix transcriptional regulator
MHYGMSKQIVVRLPDELVDFIDGVVDSGGGRSRAAVIANALERERIVAGPHAEILAGSASELELAEHAGLGEIESALGVFDGIYGPGYLERLRSGDAISLRIDDDAI